MPTDTLIEDVLPPASQGGEDGGIDVLALAAALISEWRLGLITFAIAAAIFVGYVYSLKPQYVATATILPQQGHGNPDTLASLFYARGPGGLYIGLLRSRSVQDDIIDHANLMQLFHVSDRELARDILAGKSSFLEGADGLLFITVRDGNAQDAATIANAYLQGLEDLNDKMGNEQSAQTRRFFERQLQQEREALIQAETQLKQVQQRTGQVAGATQAQIGISTIAALRAQESGLEVQRAALLKGATEQNPDVQRLNSQIAQLQAQERALEQGGNTPVGAPPPALQIPQLNLDLIRAQREVGYHEALVNSLSAQYETARLNEASARSAFQIVDLAIPPEIKAWPPRRAYLMISLIFAALIGLVLMVLKLVYRRITADPRHRGHLTVLRQAIWAK